MRANAVCHPERQLKARGLCAACHARARRQPEWQPQRKGREPSSQRPGCHPERPYYARGFCRSCYWREGRKPSVRTREERRVSNMRSHHGLTPTGYVALDEAQGGGCAICRQPETKRDKFGRPQPLSVDHDHSTGRIRGLLCHACNYMLGLAKDDPERLRAAADYLDLAEVK